MRNRQPNPREEYLLKFLLGAEWVDLPLAHALLSPQVDLSRGVAKAFGAAKTPRNSFTYVMLRRLVAEKVLRRPSDIQAYTYGRGALRLFDAPKEQSIVRSYSQSRKNPAYIKHDLITTHFLVTLDLARQCNPRWNYRVLSGAKEPTLVFRNQGNLRLDKLVEIWDAQNPRMRFWYFVEADRTSAIESSIPGKRSIVAKAEKFYAYADAGRFKSHWGIPGARLLFMVETEKWGRLQKFQEAIKRSRRIHPQNDLFRYLPARQSQIDNPELVASWLCV